MARFISSRFALFLYSRSSCELVDGLTPIKTKVFYLVSQVGMIAGTAVYINAGTQLGEIETLSGIISAPVLVSLALLGVFPFVAKFVMGIVQKRASMLIGHHRKFDQKHGRDWCRCRRFS